MTLTLSDVNALSPPEFVALFGDVAEHARWAAEAAAEARPFANRQAMLRAFETAIASAPRQMQMALLRAHPDLAGKAAIAKMAEDSRREQAGAGLDRLTRKEFAKFAALNERYRTRFGFPFILAVKGATKQQILDAFEKRIGNSEDDEFRTALSEVLRIVRFRIEERVGT